MINPLKVATSGYLKRTTKAVLVIAVAGYLNFGGTPPIPPTGGGGDGYIASRYENRDEEKRRKEQKEYNEKLLVQILEFWSKEMQ